jgi:hypothetical protein
MGQRQRLNGYVFLLGRCLAGDVFADLKEVFNKLQVIAICYCSTMFVKFIGY